MLQDGGAPEYMYHDRTAWRCTFFVGKKYGCSKGYAQKMLPIWAAFLCAYPLLQPYFLPTKTHNATLFYRGHVRVFRGAAIL
jgi:hypothetical protein